MTTRRCGKWLMCLALCVCAASSLGGCNILGPAIYFAVGPDKVQPAYELPKDRPTVIFIDDRANRIPQRSVRELIGTVAEKTLLENSAARNVIESRRVQAVVARERFGKPMGIAEVGQALEAEVVIYAWVDEFSLTPDGQTYSPSASLRVKVIDATTKERLFPPEGADPWHIVSVNVPLQQGAPPSTNAEKALAEENLARWVGRALGRQFFEHESRLDPVRLDEKAP